MKSLSESPFIRLEITTFREGPLAAMGHDLRLSAPVVPVRRSQGLISVDIDCQSIEVLGSVGEQTSELKPLPKKHRHEILKIIHKQILRTHLHPRASFDGRMDSSSMSGQLTLMGCQQEVKLQLSQSPSGWCGQVRLQPSRWGIESYSTFFGALRVRDDVLIKCWFGDE